VALTAACAAFLWLSPPAPAPTAAAEKEKAAGADRPPEAIQANRHGVTARRGKGRKDGPGAGAPAPRGGPVAEADDPAATLTGAVTWKRVLRWVALGFVPSSLMLGATTYITTDIAAIAFLWVLPLALYLLSFIIVFSRVPAWVHKAVILILPLAVLLLIFLTLSSDAWRLSIGWRVGIHLGVLFVVAMACHGELARDRPAASHLTGFYLWMSVGGVAGGLFNALVAPLAFNAIVEYPLALVLACLLTPGLGPARDSLWGRRADVVLACLFVAVGGLLIVLRLRDHDLHFEHLSAWPWQWAAVAVAVAGGAALSGALRGGDRRQDRWLDLVLPVCLAVLVVGLYWGLWSDALWPRLSSLAKAFHTRSDKLRMILTVGVPVVMCYTFVERSFRFALGLGAILLAAGFCGFFEDRILHQERSFFGVLRVENLQENFEGERHEFRRLIHGTTMHGMQYRDDERRDNPVSYYHPSGPMGQLMETYNADGRRNMAVIGLGTGTMACYARPGQHVTFYDIDPVVRRLSFDEGNPYFTFVADARRRGAHVDLVMGDARLTMERKQLGEGEKYGLIVVDAFSSDAIPVHLMTREALQVYLDKLTEDGLIVFHISNRYLDLRPVLANLAKDQGLATIYQSDDREQYAGKSRSTWVVLARQDKYLAPLRELNDWPARRRDVQRELLAMSAWLGGEATTTALAVAGFLDQEPGRYRPYSEWEPLQPSELESGELEKWPDPEKVGVWTDDYSNLFSVFSW
jgi:spermidine synthase